jgi:hypothetical protein
MSQNLVSLPNFIPSLPEVDAALTQLEAAFASFITLDPEVRQSIRKMGDQSEPFCRQTLTLLLQNPSVVPPSLDVSEMQSDLANVDALRPRLMRLTKLVRLAEDTEMALGSDVMVASTIGYRYLGMAGKDEGLEDLLKQVSTRWQRKRSKPVEPTPES